MPCSESNLVVTAKTTPAASAFPPASVDLNDYIGCFSGSHANVHFLFHSQVLAIFAMRNFLSALQCDVLEQSHPRFGAHMPVVASLGSHDSEKRLIYLFPRQTLDTDFRLFPFSYRGIMSNARDHYVSLTPVGYNRSGCAIRSTCTR